MNDDLPNYDEGESETYSDMHDVRTNRKLDLQLLKDVLLRLYDAGFREAQ